MLELLNCAACFLLMLYSLPVAMVVSNRGMILQRLSIVAVQIGLFLQATNPWAAWVPEIYWPSSFLHVAAAVMLTVWRKRAWIFVRSYLAPVDCDLDHMRRREDWLDPESAQPRGVHHRSGFPV